MKQRICAGCGANDVRWRRRWDAWPLMPSTTMHCPTCYPRVVLALRRGRARIAHQLRDDGQLQGVIQFTWDAREARPRWPTTREHQLAQQIVRQLVYDSAAAVFQLQGILIAAAFEREERAAFLAIWCDLANRHPDGAAGVLQEMASRLRTLRAALEYKRDLYVGWLPAYAAWHALNESRLNELPPDPFGTPVRVAVS